MYSIGGMPTWTISDRLLLPIHPVPLNSPSHPATLCEFSPPHPSPQRSPKLSLENIDRDLSFSNITMLMSRRDEF